MVLVLVVVAQEPFCGAGADNSRRIRRSMRMRVQLRMRKVMAKTMQIWMKTLILRRC